MPQRIAQVAITVRLRGEARGGVPEEVSPREVSRGGVPEEVSNTS